MGVSSYQLVVVDDEEDVDTIFRIILEDLILNDVFEYNYFKSGKECLEFLKSADRLDKIFLILSDINMPEMDGFSLLRQIKSNYNVLTVFMVSAYCDEVYVSKAKELGADEYLVKPIDFELLRKKLLSLLENCKKREN